MLRITIITPLNHAVTLRLEGQIADRWAMELETVVAQVYAEGSPVVLDLAGVSFIDNEGLRVLRSLANVRLMNASPFVAELMKGAGL